MRVRKISRLHQDLMDIIRKVSDVTNIRDIECFIEFGTDDIDCFLGGIHKVYIKGVRDGVPVKMRVMIKWHSNPADRVCFRASYHREYVFYHNMLPKLLELQRRCIRLEGLKMKFPNCMFSCIEYDRETIVMSITNDFRHLDRFCRMDFAHTSLVIKNLAILHALSFALQRKCPDDFEALRGLCANDIQYSDLERIPKCLISYFKSSVNVVNNPLTKAKLEGITPNILALLSKCSAPVPNYSTICHGDCWNNNILFKYQDEKDVTEIYDALLAPITLPFPFPTKELILDIKARVNKNCEINSLRRDKVHQIFHQGKRPVDVLFVDYQLVRYASPATDISYYLYMSTDVKFLSKHYNQLVDIYFGTLTAVLRQCDLDVEDVYPRSIFERHLKEYSVLGLIEALISMKIITAETEEALKMTEMKYHSEEPCQYETQNQSLYAERVNGVVEDFFARNHSLDSVLR